ncbi:MAG: DUF6526 family protein [Bacteroidota bacterium]
MPKQSYSNHRRLVWWYHGFLFPLCLVTFIGSIVNLLESIGSEGNLYSASLLVVVSFTLIFFFFAIRVYALKLQDRLIRAEENFRHMVLTGRPLDARLRTSQIIGLRFAPDEEFPELCKKAVEKQLSMDEIKKSVVDWRGDYRRV